MRAPHALPCSALAYLFSAGSQVPRHTAYYYLCYGTYIIIYRIMQRASSVAVSALALPPLSWLLSPSRSHRMFALKKAIWKQAERHSGSIRQLPTYLPTCISTYLIYDAGNVSKLLLVNIQHVCTVELTSAIVIALRTCTPCMPRFRPLAEGRR